MKKRIIALASTAAGLALPFATRALQFDNGFGLSLGLGSQRPDQIVVYIANTLLGLLGIIAVVLIIYAGFLWMTAAGNEEQVEKAQGILKAAIIGALIIIASYGIAQYVFGVLIRATGATAS